MLAMAWAIVAKVKPCCAWLSRKVALKTMGLAVELRHCHQDWDRTDPWVDRRLNCAVRIEYRLVRTDARFSRYSVLPAYIQYAYPLVSYEH
jgi:hypothetical protein